MGCMHSNEDLERLRSSHHLNESYLSEIACNGHIADCVPLNRLKNTIKYYNEWEQKQQQSDTPTTGIYEHIMNSSDNVDGLTELLQDYHHFIHKHSNEYETIYNELTASFEAPCNHKKCAMMKRNHRDRSNHKQRRQIYSNHKDHNEVICQQLLDQIHVYTLHQYDMGLKLTKNEQNELKQCMPSDENEEENDKNEFAQDYVRAPKQMRAEQIGRIMRKKKDQICANEEQKSEKNKFNMSVADDAMFSFGVRFFYDVKYKNNEDLDYKFNKGSYTYSHWYVEPKYENLKIELLQNNKYTLSKSQYKDLYFKSKQYLLCQHVKEHCQYIKLSNLMSLMIYCNFDDLQRELTKTYRKIDANESDESLKERHSEFCCLGGILRQSVEKNGISVQKGGIETFYHGINRELMFTSTLHKFCGPISTTSEYAVALMFTNNNGILVELRDGTLLSRDKDCVYFDCEWLSDFGYEKEKFFIGGLSPLKIVSIFHVLNGENYGMYIELITMLLAIIEGDMIEMAVKKEKAMIRLLKHEMDIYKIETLPIYIVKLLHYICCDVKQITIRYTTFKYKLLHKFLFFDDCQLFNLHLVQRLFPNLHSIAIECSSLTNKVFDRIIRFLNESYEEVAMDISETSTAVTTTRTSTTETSLNNIIFHSPISPSISFESAQKKYSSSLEAFNWAITYQKKEKRLIVRKNKLHKHDRMCSAHIKNAKDTFIEAEQFILQKTLSLYHDDGTNPY